MKTAKVIFKGKRINGRSMLQAFQHGKKEIYWGAHHLRFGIIGHVYEAERTPAGKLALSRNPKDLGRAPGITQEQVDGWHAKQLADEALVAWENAKRRVAASQGLNEKLEPLRPIISKMSYFERRALADYIVNRFTPPTFTRIKTVAVPKRCRKQHK